MDKTMRHFNSATLPGGRTGLFSVALFAVVLYGCGSLTNLAGTSSGVETKVVRGMVVYENGTGSYGAEVTLVPSAYNPVIGQALPKNLRAMSDITGRYAFHDVDTGTYNVLAAHNGTGTSALRLTVHVTGDSVDILTDTLRNPGAINVRLPGTADALRGYVYIPGSSNFSFLNGNSDSIILAAVPAGTIKAVCYSATNSTVCEVIRNNIQVLPGDTMVLFNPAWKYARQLFLNTSASGAHVPGNVMNFPVLVRLTSGNFSFAQAQAGGADIRFTKPDNTFIPYEIERWDPVNGAAEVWVKVDTILGGSDTQYLVMYWGNSGSSDSSNGVAVFDTADGFTGVWHMNENPSAGANSIKDRTANYFNATPHGFMNAADVVDGAVGKGLDFDGSNDYLNAGKVALTGPYSVGLWVRLDRINDYQRLIFQDSAYTLWYDSDRSGARMEHLDSSEAWRGIPQDGGAVQPMTTGAWYYLTGTYDGDRVRLYVNGALAAETSSMGAPPGSYGYDLIFGDAWNVGFVNGIMDEIRVERASRSADWIRLCSMNQRGDDKLVAFR